MPRPDLVPESGFTAVADRIWVARYASYDVNVTLVEGERGLVLIDTRESAEAAAALLDDVRRVADPDRLVAVVNTHDHHDHIGGNALLTERFPGLEVICHDGAADACATSTATFSSVRTLDLGDRSLDLVHPGPAHTGGDLVVAVPDAGVLVAGDLVEESAPPSRGEDSHPQAWPVALDLVISLLTPAGVVVPGHGALVDRDFVEEQRHELAHLAEEARRSRQLPLA